MTNKRTKKEEEAPVVPSVEPVVAEPAAVEANTIVASPLVELPFDTTPLTEEEEAEIAAFFGENVRNEQEDVLDEAPPVSVEPTVVAPLVPLTSEQIAEESNRIAEAIAIPRMEEDARIRLAMITEGFEPWKAVQAAQEAERLRYEQEMNALARRNAPQGTIGAASETVTISPR